MRGSPTCCWSSVLHAAPSTWTRLLPKQAPGFKGDGLLWQPSPLGARQPFGAGPGTAPRAVGAAGGLGWSWPCPPEPSLWAACVPALGWGSKDEWVP